MTDPRQGDVPNAEALTDVEREARVEQLLVSGLDEYFAGRLEQAVNVWTRVLFLDRSNDRARAYIDRARRAQAERQRETEALMHEGLQAFDDGDVDRARRLLTAAVERGAPHEQTLPVLHRIGLLNPSLLSAALPVATVPRWRRAGVIEGDPATRWRVGPILVMAGAIAVAALVLTRMDGGPDPAVPVATLAAGLTPLPVPGVSEAYLSRADLLFRAGKLADALATLGRIEPGDSGFREAQQLRANVQRALLSAAAGVTTTASEPQP